MRTALVHTQTHTHSHTHSHTRAHAQLYKDVAAMQQQVKEGAGMVTRLRRGLGLARANVSLLCGWAMGWYLCCCHSWLAIAHVVLSLP